MPDTVNVASRAPMAIEIREPLPEQYKDKPGEAPPLKSAVLNGANHPQAVNGAGITQGVDAALFKAWLQAEQKASTALAQLVKEAGDGDMEEQPGQYGFEPALDAMKADADNAAAAAEGSTVDHPGPLSSDEMAAHSDTPNDDTARGDPDLVQQGHTQTPATALASPSPAPSPAPAGAGTPAAAAPDAG